MDFEYQRAVEGDVVLQMSKWFLQVIIVPPWDFYYYGLSAELRSCFDCPSTNAGAPIATLKVNLPCYCLCY